MQINMATQKGKIPLNIVDIGISFATPCKTNTLTPTGGVMRLISMVHTMTTPNQMGSNPRLITMG